MNNIMSALQRHTITVEWMHTIVSESVGDFMENVTNLDNEPPFGVVNGAFEDWCIHSSCGAL